MSIYHQQIVHSLKKRHRAEARFRWYGRLSLGFAVAVLGYLLTTIAAPGISGFIRHEVKLMIPAQAVTPIDLEQAYNLTTQALKESVGQDAPQSPLHTRQLIQMVGTFAAHEVRKQVNAQPQLVAYTIWVPLGDNVDMVLKGKIDTALEEHLRPIKDRQLAWLAEWQAAGNIRASFNTAFFTDGDSRAPEAAGVGASIIGSLFTLLVCMLAAVPMGVLAAIYLEEFSAKNRLTEWIEILINNLAAVPSIIYGLLGLSLYLNFFGMPRSAPLVGGLTLALLVLPVIIISTRAALRAVPPSMRHAAVALGATPLQTVLHHVVPYALPGMLTGAILATSRAIGETAPLLMIGMVAFIADIPRGVMDAATAMPVQIYLWASSPELGFVEKTSSAILVLLAMLVSLNLLAIYLRRRYEMRW